MVSGSTDRSKPAEDFEHDPRYAISLREAWWCVGYWAAFTILMVAIAWGMAGHRDPAETSYIMGFPDWFFWTGIVVVGVFSTVVPFVMVRLMFTHVDLSPRPTYGPGSSGTPASPVGSSDPGGQR